MYSALAAERATPSLLRTVSSWAWLKSPGLAPPPAGGVGGTGGTGGVGGAGSGIGLVGCWRKPVSGREGLRQEFFSGKLPALKAGRFHQKTCSFVKQRDYPVKNRSHWVKNDHHPVKNRACFVKNRDGRLRPSFCNGTRFSEHQKNPDRLGKRTGSFGSDRVRKAARTFIPRQTATGIVTCAHFSGSERRAHRDSAISSATSLVSSR